MFYVPLEEAREKLLERRAIRPQVEMWWEEKGMPFPELLLDQTKQFGLNVRQLASCRYEDLLFIAMCEKGGLTPLWAPYERDWYVDKSPLKCSYLQPRIVTGFGKTGKPILRKQRLVHPMMCQGKKLDEILINHVVRMSLVDWHRLWREWIYPEAIVNDFSHIYKGAGGRPQDYYSFLLSLFVAHGVLIEDYHGGESGNRLDLFTGNIFEPAFAEVETRFGTSPLIVPLPWWKELGYYPSLELCKVRDWRTHPILREYRG